MSEAQRIAAKLTKTQRWVISRGDALRRNGRWYSPNIATARALYRLGLIDYPSYIVNPTPLGLEVRKILEAQS